MSTSEPEPAGAETAGPEEDSPEARRRRRELIFGDVLPEGTSDDRDSEPESGGRSRDDWYRDNVPPHH